MARVLKRPEETSEPDPDDEVPVMGIVELRAADQVDSLDDDDDTTELEPTELRADESADVDPVTEPPARPLAEDPEPRSRLGRIRDKAPRWLIIAALAAAVVVAAIVVWPEFDKRVLQSVESNASDTAALTDRLVTAEAAVAGLEESTASLVDDLRALTTAQGDFAGSLAGIDGLIAEHTARLDVLDLDAVEGDVALTVGISTIKSMELLSRARLFLYQANYGLAKQDVQSARDILATIGQEADAGASAAAVERLDLVLAALPDLPVAASADLDIAWQLLLGETAESPAVVAEEPVDPVPASSVPAAEATPETTVP